jgi:CheY-like chemotaxis protein
MERKSFSYYLKRYASTAGLAPDSKETLRSVSEADEEKREFLAVLAHELRNPLSAILSSVELLTLQQEHSVEASKLLRSIEERVYFTTSILDDLLELTRVSEHTVTPPQLSGSKRRTKQPRTILVVDDNEIAAKALGRLLQLRGHNVSIAYTGAEALHEVRQYAPEIILLDIGLPDMDGYEVLRILRREKTFSSKVIALTGYGQPQDKVRASKAGFYAHLTKPVSAKEIEAAFRKAPHAR